MGLCGSKLDETTAAINREVKSQSRNDNAVKKLLLLGAGGSGKSTIFKQLKSIHGAGISLGERKSYKSIVIGNVIDFMRVLCFQSDKLSSEPETAKECAKCRMLDESRAAAQIVTSQEDMGFYDMLEPEVAQAIEELWRDPGIKKTFEERSRYQMQDSAEYFFDKRMSAVSQEDYIPTEKDVLMARVRTTGIIEQEFECEKTKFRVFDVGGQRNERKKWIHCFENVTAVIFVASLSGYDQKLLEEDNVNRMEEALDLFAQINDPTGHFGAARLRQGQLRKGVQYAENNQQRIMLNKREYQKMGVWFQDTAMILFLNKSDLFERRVLKKPLALCPYFKEYRYPMYEGVTPKDAGLSEDSGAQWDRYYDGLNYVRENFEIRNKAQGYNGQKKNLYVHVTNATDQGIIRKVFADVQHLILQSSMIEAGIM